MDPYQTPGPPYDLPRDDFRVPSNVKARYQHGEKPARDIRLQNISRGGICIIDDFCIDIGTSLRLILKMQDRVIDAFGEVIWNKEEDGRFIHGIKFTFMEQDSRHWFNTFIMDWAAEQFSESLDFSSLTGMEADASLERRKFARLRMPLRVDFGFMEGTRFIRTHTTDISEGGLCFTCQFALKPDQELHLWLWLNEKDQVSLNGRVRHSVTKKINNQNVYFHGLEFTDNTADELDRLSNFLLAKRSEMAAIEITFEDIVNL